MRDVEAIINAFFLVPRTPMPSLPVDHYQITNIFHTKIFNGKNLLEVLGHPDVDHTTTFSNDIVEICDTLGIEAGNV